MEFLNGRLAIDLIAVVLIILVLRSPLGGPSSERPRFDVLAPLLILNVALHLVAVVIIGADLGLGAGFGLFALLSIVRLRSSTFTSINIAYVFAVLSLAVLTAVASIDIGFVASASALMVVVVAVGAALATHRATTKVDVTLDGVVCSPTRLVEELEVLGLEPVSTELLEVDSVRQLTRVRVTVSA